MRHELGIMGTVSTLILHGVLYGQNDYPLGQIQGTN